MVLNQLMHQGVGIFRLPLQKLQHRTPFHARYGHISRHLAKRQIHVHSLRNNVPNRPPLQLSTSLIRPYYFSTEPSQSVNEPAAKSLEDTYSRKTPLEHILLRPSMYVGPTERLPPVSSWVLQSDVDSSEQTSSTWTMQRQELSYTPALIKIFDEILVNASDNRLRHPGSCNRIDVIIHRGDEKGLSKDILDQIPDPSKPYISIRNNGKSIPVQIHKKEKIYIPELLFGHLLTGSNFDDNEKRLTGGRHGYGAKLTNVFSEQFTLEIGDAHSTKGKYKMYKQHWEKNMSICHEAEVATVDRDAGMNKNELEFTKISFIPDLGRLTGNSSISMIPEEEYQLMKRRVVDIAGCAGGKLAVTLNGEPIALPGFHDYIELYRHQANNSTQLPPTLYHKLNARWEVVLGLSEQKSLESISFVNGMNTSRGGTHVDVIARQISQYIADYINTKMAKELDRLQAQAPINITSHMVRRHMFLCVNSLIENPSFDSQMKECLTSNPENFGSHFELPNSFLRKLVKPVNGSEDNDEDTIEASDEEEINKSMKSVGPGIVEQVIRMAMGAHQFNISKLMKEIGASSKQTKRQVLSIPKLEDANLAGTASVSTSNPCTLILTEGDSAKALAVAGLEVMGRDHFGVFPLRGKFINVRSVSVKQLTNNAELKAMCTILGLQFDKTYEMMEERQELRYGHVMLMTDQDADGSHIKGLIMNMFRYYWPALLKPPVDDVEGRPFLSMFITPLLKATKKGKKKESLSFFSMSEYDSWRESLEDDEVRKWNVKYYKGLGTSTPAEAKDYFLSFVQHYRPFRWESEQKDGERLDMAFEKDRADDRKDWILNVYDKKSQLNLDEKNSITYGDFVDNELIHFSNANNIRSLPSVIDGLKPSQRKVLYACFKRNLKDEIKVAQLAGYCAEHTAYHHGEASLHATIIGMAQDFCGSNNINLLTPSGQFGTRLEGGKDCASPRYIFTHLSPIARLIFPVEDDMLLSFKEEDGQMIEPEYYCPIIPLLLVNGCQGIGTGWSTFIPQHNPLQVLHYIRAKLDKAELPPIEPYVRGFSGAITTGHGDDNYITEGIITSSTKSSVTITELPIGVWTNDYKTSLVAMLKRGEIQSFTQDHTTTKVCFNVKVNTARLNRLLKSDTLIKQFKLRNTLSTRNMHAFTPNMSISRYTTPQDIADEYFPIRLRLYSDRKSVMESNMEYSASLMKNKSRFIQAVSEDKIDLLHGRKSKDATTMLLQDMGFSKQSDLDAIKMNNDVARRHAFDNTTYKESSEHEADTNDFSKEYDYLLNLPLSSLTSERIEALNEETSKTEAKLDIIRNTSAADLWRDDLDKLEPYLK